MGDEVEFLERIYQNTCISENNLRRIRKERKSKDKFDELLKEICFKYRKICVSLKAMIERRKKKISDISILTQLATYMNVKLNIGNYDNIQNISQMIIQGTKTEKDEIIRLLDEYNLKNKNVLNIANRILDFENQTINLLEEYTIS